MEKVELTLDDFLFYKKNGANVEPKRVIVYLDDVPSSYAVDDRCCILENEDVVIIPVRIASDIETGVYIKRTGVFVLFCQFYDKVEIEVEANSIQPKVVLSKGTRVVLKDGRIGVLELVRKSTHGDLLCSVDVNGEKILFQGYIELTDGETPPSEIVAFCSGDVELPRSIIATLNHYTTKEPSNVNNEDSKDVSFGYRVV